MTALLFIFNQQLGFFKKSALEQLCKVASKWVNWTSFFFDSFLFHDHVLYLLNLIADLSLKDLWNPAIINVLLLMAVNLVLFLDYYLEYQCRVSFFSNFFMQFIFLCTKIHLINVTFHQNFFKLLFNNFIRYNTCWYVASQAVEDIHNRACYETYPEVMLATNAIRNSSSSGPTGILKKDLEFEIKFVRNAINLLIYICRQICWWLIRYKCHIFNFNSNYIEIYDY